MKKKALRVFSILFPIVLIMMACGCPSGQSNKKTELTPEEIEEKYKDVPLDPLGCYIEDESWVLENKGFYLVRDGVFYSLNEVASIKERPEYNVGRYGEGNEFQTLFTRTGGYMGKDSGEYLNTWDDYELLKHNKDTDEIRSYAVSTVELIKFESLGYGFRRDMTAESMDLDSGLISTTDGQKRISDKSKQLTYVLNGEEIEHNYNLEKGTEVTASWYEGTTYYEYTCVADTRYYYSWEKDSKNVMGHPEIGPIKLEGTLCKEGYATYDLSGIEPGMYVLVSTEFPDKKFGETILKGGGVLIIE